MPLVPARGVQGEVFENLPGAFVHDDDVSVFDDEDDAGSDVGSSDADGVHSRVVAQRDLALPVDPVDTVASRVWGQLGRGVLGRANVGSPGSGLLR